MGQGESTRATCPKEILITLLKGGKTFEQIVSELSHYSRGTINKYINELYENQLITRVGRRGPYILTKKGEKEAKVYEESRKLSELASFPQISFKLDVGKEIFKGKVRTLLEVAPEGSEAFCDVAIYLDEEKREMLDKISSFIKQDRQYPEVCLRRIATHFIDLLKLAIFNAYGFLSWQGWEIEPLQFQKAVEQERKTLDFEATLVLHFNGKELVRQIDWDGLIKNHEDSDKSLREYWQIFVSTVTNDSSVRRSWLINEVIEKTRKVESARADLIRFLPGSPLEILTNMWDAFGSPEKAKEALFSDVYGSLLSIMLEGLTGGSFEESHETMIKAMMKELNEKYREIMEKQLPEDEASEALMEFFEKRNLKCDQQLKLTKQQKQKLRAAKAQAKRVIDKLIQEGILEFVPIYLPRLRDMKKADATQQQAKAGYPSSPLKYMLEKAAPNVGAKEAEKDSSK